ncbi:hypothetical protein D3C86_1332990 [compost metagenome]
MHAFVDFRVGVLVRGAVAADQVDLQVVERVDVGEAFAQRDLQRGVVGQQFALGQELEHGERAAVFGADGAEDAFAQGALRDELGVAGGDGEVGFGQHHFHIGEQGAEGGPVAGHFAQLGQA